MSYSGLDKYSDDVVEKSVRWVKWLNMFAILADSISLISLCIVILVSPKTASMPIYVYYADQKPSNITGTVPMYVINSFSPAIFSIVFCAMSLSSRLYFYCWPNWKQIKIGKYPFIWFEYFYSASIMMVQILWINLLNHIVILLLGAACIATMITFGDISDRELSNIYLPEDEIVDAVYNKLLYQQAKKEEREEQMKNLKETKRLKKLATSDKKVEDEEKRAAKAAAKLLKKNKKSAAVKVADSVVTLGKKAVDVDNIDANNAKDVLIDHPNEYYETNNEYTVAKNERIILINDIMVDFRKRQWNDTPLVDKYRVFLYGCIPWLMPWISVFVIMGYSSAKIPVIVWFINLGTFFNFSVFGFIQFRKIRNSYVPDDLIREQNMNDINRYQIINTLSALYYFMLASLISKTYLSWLSIGALVN
jgi:hypothetical protein